eukprot:TRINITY_DN12161_c0_g1_i3.p1 TRINITY_DN12161_c0_g1~~TRINITY_DN12161_c0_g1_i3.p1  ORF type:complete len:744 (+),score=153.78 TRINITY_DN12161_c0_g1_i3:51-2282(+)
MSGFRIGEQVAVYSSSQQKWVDAIIQQAVDRDCELEGYNVPAGSIKVAFAGGQKWILPHLIAQTVVKKSAPAAVAAAAPPPAGGGAGGGYAAAAAPVAICKIAGCGLPVQPGLTRNMKAFDTCCKTCAMTNGKGGHDGNCSLRMSKRPSQIDAKALDSIVDPVRWMDHLLVDAKAYNLHAGHVFQRAAAGGDRLSPDQLTQALSLMLLSPVGIKVPVTPTSVSHLVQNFDSSGTGSLNFDDFAKLCRHCLLDWRTKWFPPKLPVRTSIFVRQNAHSLESIYEMREKLGEGSFGEVFRVCHRVSGEIRVCKKISRLKGAMDIDEILGEIKSMAMLDHPNVIKVFEYFVDGEFVSQIMEPCNGGELKHRIDEVFRNGKPFYGEGFIRDVMKQIMRALAFMHSERFMHKDLKPENVMMVDKTTSSIKVIDFGLAELFNKDQKLSTAAGGTLLYMAPEVFDRKLDMRCDVWSAGIIVYNLITGDYPFLGAWPLPPGKTIEWWQVETERIIRQEPHKKHRRLADGTVSRLCVELMELMLTKLADARPHAAQTLEHPWFKQFEDQPPTLSVGVTQCLDAYSSLPELKKALFLFIVHQFAPAAGNELRALFTHFDFSNRGTLSLAALSQVLTQAGMDALQVARVVHALDKDSDGMVEWTEFLAAVLCVSVSRKENLLNAAFMALDEDKDGRIQPQDFENLFAVGGVKDLWRKELPNQCKELGPAPYSRDAFVKYLGAHMKVTCGSALSAV